MSSHVVLSELLVKGLIPESVGDNLEYLLNSLLTIV